MTMRPQPGFLNEKSDKWFWIGLILDLLVWLIPWVLFIWGLITMNQTPEDGKFDLGIAWDGFTMFATGSVILIINAIDGD